MIQSRHRRRRGDRSGIIYLTVLGVTLVVAILATTGMSIARLERRVAAAEANRHEARLLARSAIEFAVSQMNDDGDWRDSLDNDDESDPVDYGAGAFTWKLTDDDNNLDDDPTDSVTLTGYGRVGDAVAVESVTLMPTGDPLTCLEVALFSDSSLTLPSGFIVYTRIESDQTVASNDDIDATNGYAYIEGDIESAGVASGDLRGSVTQGVATRDMPGESVFDYYLTNGTWIDIASIPLDGSDREIRNTVLSPSINPYGATNREGIYVIDCQGEKLELSWMRSIGTLVILNPGSGSGLNGQNVLSNAVPNYPALMVRGDFRLRCAWYGNEMLDEGSSNVNYNPVGAPFEGVEDNDRSDSYSTGIDGLVYVSGTATFPDRCAIEGGLVAGSVNVNSLVRLEIDYRATYFRYPPPGFAKGPGVQIIPGSWRRGTLD